MMDLESKIFEKAHPDFNKFLDYGFRKQEAGYSYFVNILQGEFCVELSISFTGLVRGKIFENYTGEEYVNVRIEEMTGAFVNKIRKAYCDVLHDVRQNCFIDDYFMTAQANRITGNMIEKYGTIPEFLWKRLKGHGVFRNPCNHKWYGIIMYIDKSKIICGEGKVEVLNIKMDSKWVPNLLREKGIYPAYHLSKKNWISVILDETVEDDRIMELIEKSYEIVMKGSIKRGEEVGTKKWIIPANPLYFDLEKAFTENPEIIWKQSNRMAVNDIVYMYVAAPFSAILYRGLVVAVDIPYTYKSKQLTIHRVMKIRLLERYNKNLFTSQWLKKYGIKAVRGPRNMPETLSAAIRNEKST